ncbi:MULTISPECIES: BREX-2 system phosphatase PglZ [Streptomyces]|uniref:BREX-2 system phosphatase PglZ n=1 Tax=Streptomyces dengpaensis TaxID=2049881 RepID=A0ABN5HXU4_9ACTN|nr:MULTISPECIES: BREX-2 system phosphatase PglZ [Streptomyces]AVH55971.1 BREX-2 system phosphatase PglZ [Streptomyces dengpaensis]PIB12222.1 phage resistance protein [Streptomyces sp. HG99]
MSTTVTAAEAAGPIAIRLNLATVTQYLSSQTSLAASLRDGDKRRVVLLRSEPVWDGPADPVWGDGHTARIAAAPSPLAVHELVLDHLAGRPARSGGGTGPAVLVVLTDREQSELDPAVLARVHKQRINSLDSWDVVREAFGARQVDQRLRDANWAAEALLDATPPGGWPSLAGGILSRRTALSALAMRRLRLGGYGTDADRSPGAAAGARVGAPAGGTLDPHSLLRWSLTPGGPELLLELRGPERAGLAEFLGEEDQAGLTGRALLALVEAEHGVDAVAFGLVCGALWLHTPADADAYRARGRAERWFGEQPPATGEQLDSLASVFARACEEYVGTLLATAARRTGSDAASEDAREARRVSDTVLERAAALVRQFGAEAAGRTSPLLPAGLEARFTAVGHALRSGRLDAVAEAVRALGDHKRADGPDARARIERARMGRRLAEWLAGDPAVACETVAAALERQIAETGWVDQALEHIEAGGDPDAVLKSAYDALAARVRERRHEIDRHFARALATWTAAGTQPGSMLTVETFLDRAVKPVVRAGGDRRVLLLVLDGMSAAIASELAEELRASWAEFDPLPDGEPRRRSMAAALPTLTAVSRTALLTGALMKGSQADEKRLLPTLKLWGGAPAAVFHKDDLRAASAGETFGPALTDALTDGRTHVAVVLNAIDDRLAKEQKLGDGTWLPEHIPGLPDLLRVAVEEGMAVLVTSDHGHVVDRHGAKAEAVAPGSARHRAPGGPLGPSEVELTGPRVVWPEPGASIVALWDADSRYTALKAGYHGGASLAEFAIPVLAFLPFGATPPKEWRELGDQRPSWWHLDERAAVPVAARPERAAPAKRPTRSKQAIKAQAEIAETHDSLFDDSQVPSAPSPAPAAAEQAAPADSLVTRLFASDALHSQAELLARKPPEREMVKFQKAVTALLDAGGTLPVTALAQRAGYPATRADGFAAVLRQLLNYDGVQVLETLPDGRTVRLHPGLLREQFGLG